MCVCVCVCVCVCESLGVLSTREVDTATLSQISGQIST